MTELLNGVEAPSDAELISRVRGGDASAYGELFSRHVGAAQRLARQLVPGPDGDDLVSEAFARTLQALQAGGGPDLAFRAYLLTSLRRLHVDRIRSGRRVQPTEDMAVYDDGEPFRDTVVEGFENSAAAKAFASLPERWQLVLWHLEVEGQKPADVAPLLGMTPNSVSALAYRAREGLRQAFLTMHLADCPTERCRWVNEHLGGYVRGGLSKRDVAKVEEHLDECRRCMAMYLELSEVNSNLAGIIAPLVLGAAAAGYLSGTGVGTSGLSLLLGRARDFVTANSGGVLTGAVAAGVAAVTTTVFVFGGGAPREVVTEADQPVETVQKPRVAAPEPRERGPRDPDARPLREAGTTEPWAPAGDGAQPVGFTPAEAVAAPAPVPAPLTEPAPPAGAPSADLPVDEPPTGGPVTVPPNEQPPVEEPPDRQPPAERPSDEEPPVENPPVGEEPSKENPPEDPPTPTVAQTSVSLGGSEPGVVDSALRFDIVGEPVLPSMVELELQLAPDGFTLETGADCQADQSSSTCLVTLENGLAGAAGVPGLTAAGTTGVVSAPVGVEGVAGGPVRLELTSADEAVTFAPVTVEFVFTPPEPPGGTPKEQPGDGSQPPPPADDDGEDSDRENDEKPVATPAARLQITSNECTSERTAPEGTDARAHCVILVRQFDTDSDDDLQLLDVEGAALTGLPRVQSQQRDQDTISVAILMPVGQDPVCAQLRLGSDGPVTDAFRIRPPTSSSATPGQATTR